MKLASDGLNIELIEEFRSRVDAKLLADLIETLARRYGEIDEEITQTKRKVSFDSAANICASTRAAWFSLMKVAQSARPSLTNDVLDRLRSRFEAAAQAISAVASSKVVSPKQAASLRTMEGFVQARIASIDTLKDGGTVQEFLNATFPDLELRVVG